MTTAPKVTHLVINEPGIPDPQLAQLIDDFGQRHGPYQHRVRTLDRLEDSNVVTFTKERVALYFLGATAILERQYGTVQWSIVKSPDDSPPPAVVHHPDLDSRREDDHGDRLRRRQREH
jgi:hypothetical protein